MEGMSWGLLGPDTVARARRARTLGLGSAVRFFNEQAVPGIGGVWYGKQLWIAMLGVALASKLQSEKQNTSNIKCANAIEALACWLALDGSNWQSDLRLRGATKLRGANDLSFMAVSKPGFYVSQPMRMATVQALPALGLVQHDATRFNQFKLSEHCLRRFDLSEKLNGAYGGYGGDILEHINQWSQGKRKAHSGKYKDFFDNALSPLKPMDDTLRRLLTDVLHCGGEFEPHANKQRRRNALLWVEGLRQQSKQVFSWDNRPNIFDVDHWQDLKTGAAFFALRDQSLEVLNALESHLGSLQNSRSFDLNKSTLPQPVSLALIELRQLASAYLALGHSEPIALQFARECSDKSDTAIMRHLIERDGRVLRLIGSVVLPGPAFDGGSSVNNTAAETSDEDAEQHGLKSLAGISTRMTNLFFLNADLHGDLDTWLGAVPFTHSEELL